MPLTLANLFKWFSCPLCQFIFQKQRLETSLVNPVSFIPLTRVGISFYPLILRTTQLRDQLLLSLTALWNSQTQRMRCTRPQPPYPLRSSNEICWSTILNSICLSLSQEQPFSNPSSLLSQATLLQLALSTHPSPSKSRTVLKMKKKRRSSSISISKDERE